MKKLIICLLSITGLLYVSAAAAQNVNLASIECTYDVRYVFDTTDVKMFNNGCAEGDTTSIGKRTMLLRCGGNVSLYYDYKRMYRDSVAATDKVMAKSLPGGISLMIYKNFGEGKVHIYDKVAMHDFKVTEKIPDFKWDISDEWDEIAGYKVRKAVCSFRGRKYEAWFAPEVPVPDGPWKFCGLPGLIMKVYDVQGNKQCHYYYCITGLRMRKTAIEYPDVKAIEVSMKKLYENKRRFYENAPQYLSATSSQPVRYVTADGKPADLKDFIKTQKYDFEEIEF